MSTTVTLSLEVELGWGHHDLPPEDRQPLSDGRDAETAALRRLLDICDDWNIPITFAVVGHLFHDSCGGKHDGAHPDRWFAGDPGTDRIQDPHVYAPDLIKLIEYRPVNHEIATHTYSHVLCDEVYPSLVEWELDTVSELHSQAGLPEPRSMVAPRHRAAPKGVLMDADIETIRVPFPDGATVSPSNSLSTFWWILTREHPLRSHQEENGVMETYCTPHPSLTAVYLPSGESPPHPAFRAIPLSVRQRLHERFLRSGVRRAKERDIPIHLWSHLYNLSCEAQFQPVESFLQYLGREAERGTIDIRPMRDLDSKHD